MTGRERAAHMWICSCLTGNYCMFLACEHVHTVHAYTTGILVAPCFKNLLRLEAGYPALRCHIVKQNTGHTHNTHNTGTTTPPNTRTKHTTEPLSNDRRLRDDGGATSRARVGGRAEVSMGSRVEVRRALARARVRRAPAGPSCPCQLEASRGHADAGSG